MKHAQPFGVRLRATLPGVKPQRIPCGAPTEDGWLCPCESRFHVT